MQQSLYAHKKDFKKNNVIADFFKGLLAIFQYIYFVLSLVVLSVGGVLLFLLEFAIVKSVTSFIFARLGIYLMAQYLTVLPTYIVILLVLLPVKFSLPITLVVSIFSLFISLSV